MRTPTDTCGGEFKMTHYRHSGDNDDMFTYVETTERVIYLQARRGCTAKNNGAIVERADAGGDKNYLDSTRTRTRTLILVKQKLISSCTPATGHESLDPREIFALCREP